MKPVPVIAIFDVGKTNKKLFLFDENYRIVFERSARLKETLDEDGFPCENLESLRLSVIDSLSEVLRMKEFSVKAVNFSAYGASLVFLDEKGKALTPLYSYLKPFPAELSRQLYDQYGGENKFASDTASPVLGSLNSGLQLFRLKIEKPEIFRRLKYALHLPQYLSWLLSGKYYSDISSIGCHTGLWDFKANRYHPWVEKEGLCSKLAPIRKSDETIDADYLGSRLSVGIGLHDSSAALIPYLLSFQKSFILISTGTWCISMNPFNGSSLSEEELHKDCLCYLQHNGNPVKASRLFAGNEHDGQAKRIAEHFKLEQILFRTLAFDGDIADWLQRTVRQAKPSDPFAGESNFKDRDLSVFGDGIAAYYQLILDLVEGQVRSTSLVLKGTSVKRIFVDGGFSKNAIYMNLLANALPGIEVFAASVAQATAIGSAMAIHDSWNPQAVPSDSITLVYYGKGKRLAQ